LARWRQRLIVGRKGTSKVQGKEKAERNKEKERKP
jgi:hypothetical protein